jgi:hypothetical protein
MPSSRVGEDRLPALRAALNFSKPIARAYANFHNPSKDIRPVETHEVVIRDARPIVDRLSLDIEGFQLFNHVSSVSHLPEGAGLQDKYHEEVGAFIRVMSGADVVLPFRPYFQVRLSRRGEKGQQGNGKTRPAAVVHSDVTEKTFLEWMKRAEEAEGVRVESWSRCVFYNTWRAISEPPQDYPLALTDASTHSARKYVIMDNDFGDGHYLETIIGLYDPDDRWYYFSDMRADELLVFKSYDTEYRGTQTVLHSSFDNTPQHPDAPPRQSIETRFFAFWR